MSKYRIIEKKGYTKQNPHYKLCWTDKLLHSKSEQKELEEEFNEDEFEYIPRFIVQDFTAHIDHIYSIRYVNNKANWKDLKEFTSLEEARAYKRNLELEDGIVIE